MPPHCDSLDGPVVRAAQGALETADVALVLPYVPKSGEREIIDAFDKVLATRKTGAVGQEVADRYFFETVVRIHRAGEGTAFTGLKPAGLDVGPIIPVAERAIEGGDRQVLEDALVQVVRSELAGRFADLERLCKRVDGSVDEARAYVGAMLGLQVWAHGVYKATKARGHAAAHTHEATNAVANR
jgi:uncharacterized protein DUF6448